MDISIHIKEGENLANICLKDADGSQQEKKITITDLYDVFKQEEASRYFCPIPLFDNYPSAVIPGLLAGKISLNSTSGIYFLPTDMRYMDFAGEKSILPFPSLLFYLSSANTALKDSRCFALKEKNLCDLTPQSVLYAFPFGNVHPKDGHICWGSNHITECQGYDSLRTAIEIFFSSQSNADYVQKGESFTGFSSYPKMLEELRKRESFPVKALVQSPYIHTLSELINKFHIS